MIEKLDHIILKAAEKGKGFKCVDYKEDINLQPIDETSEEDEETLCKYPKLDYKLIDEEEDMLKDKSYFNTQVFNKVHTLMGFGQGFGKMGKWCKEEYRPETYPVRIMS